MVLICQKFLWVYEILFSAKIVDPKNLLAKCEKRPPAGEAFRHQSGTNIRKGFRTLSLRGRDRTSWGRNPKNLPEVSGRQKHLHYHIMVFSWISLWPLHREVQLYQLSFPAPQARAWCQHRWGPAPGLWWLPVPSVWLCIWTPWNQPDWRRLPGFQSGKIWIRQAGCSSTSGSSQTGIPRAERILPKSPCKAGYRILQHMLWHHGPIGCSTSSFRNPCPQTSYQQKKSWTTSCESSLKNWWGPFYDFDSR